jgi:protein-S-isoprenylcysteine O-methyltransferase Ste14
MIPQTVAAILLAIPLVRLAIQSIDYWSEFRRERGAAESTANAGYRKPYFQLLVFGVLCMWVAWLGGIAILLLNEFDTVFGSLIFQGPSAVLIQIGGFVIFYLGAVTYNLTLFAAGKYLRPAPSGIHGEHRLIQEGPYGVIRHPLYVSYILILAGLSLALLMVWLLIPVVCIVVGIYPTAKAEEEVLAEQLGEEYNRYKQRVGMLFPRLF